MRAADGLDLQEVGVLGGHRLQLGGQLVVAEEPVEGRHPADRRARCRHRHERRPTGHGAYHPAMATLVILRHGESTWNRRNLFTGWHDVPLSEVGRAEAVGGGRHAGLEAGLWFDVLHTSVLTRAVETANLALAALGQPWLPVRRSWRLNERHYGALQGLDKKETTERHGAAQTKRLAPLVRRATAPGRPRQPRAPDATTGATACCHPTSSRPPSAWPTSSPACCPTGTTRSSPSCGPGSTVLVVAHGNSLRALVKHLEDISDDDIAELNIPTGVPRRYVLDDESLAVVGAAYLGDADAVAAAAAAVAQQAGA